MQIVTRIGLTAAIALSFGIASSADSQSKNQSQGYGYVTSEGVWLARVQPIEKLLKGDCGIRLTDIVGVQSNRGSFGGGGRRCDPNMKEKQKFHVIKLRPGENFEVVARTQGGISQGSFNNRQRVGLGTLKGDSQTCYAIVTYKGKKLVRVPVRSGRRDQYLFSNPLAAVGAENENAQAALKTAEQTLESNKSRYLVLDGRLRRSSAWNASAKQCFQPQQRALPRKPPPSPDTTLSAPARCVENLTRQWRYDQVADGLNSEGRRDALSAHSEWRRQGSKAPSCVGRAADSTINRSTEMVPWDKWGGDTIRRTHIAGRFNSCVRAVQRSCGSAMNSWYSQVANIKAEPRKTYQSCLADQREIQGIATQYRGYEQSVTNAKARVNAAQPAFQQVDLANARCGSAL